MYYHNIYRNDISYYYSPIYVVIFIFAVMKSNVSVNGVQYTSAKFSMLHNFIAFIQTIIDIIGVLAYIHNRKWPFH